MPIMNSVDKSLESLARSSIAAMRGDVRVSVVGRLVVVVVVVVRVVVVEVVVVVVVVVVEESKNVFFIP